MITLDNPRMKTDDARQQYTSLHQLSRRVGSTPKEELLSNALKWVALYTRTWSATKRAAITFQPGQSFYIESDNHINIDSTVLINALWQQGPAGSQYGRRDRYINAILTMAGYGTHEIWHALVGDDDLWRKRYDRDNFLTNTISDENLENRAIWDIGRRVYRPQVHFTFIKTHQHAFSYDYYRNADLLRTPDEKADPQQLMVGFVFQALRYDPSNYFTDEQYVHTQYARGYPDLNRAFVELASIAKKWNQRWPVADPNKELVECFDEFWQVINGPDFTATGPQGQQDNDATEQQQGDSDEQQQGDSGSEPQSKDNDAAPTSGEGDASKDDPDGADGTGAQDDNPDGETGEGNSDSDDSGESNDSGNTDTGEQDDECNNDNGNNESADGGNSDSDNDKDDDQDSVGSDSDGESADGNSENADQGDAADAGDDNGDDAEDSDGSDPGDSGADSDAAGTDSDSGGDADDGAGSDSGRGDDSHPDSDDSQSSDHSDGADDGASQADPVDNADDDSGADADNTDGDFGTGHERGIGQTYQDERTANPNVTKKIDDLLELEAQTTPDDDMNFDNLGARTFDRLLKEADKITPLSPGMIRAKSIRHGHYFKGGDGTDRRKRWENQQEWLQTTARQILARLGATSLQVNGLNMITGQRSGTGIDPHQITNLWENGKIFQRVDQDAKIPVRINLVTDFSSSMRHYHLANDAKSTVVDPLIIVKSITLALAQYCEQYGYKFAITGFTDDVFHFDTLYDFVDCELGGSTEDANGMLASIKRAVDEMPDAKQAFILLSDGAGDRVGVTEVIYSLTKAGHHFGQIMVDMTDDKMRLAKPERLVELDSKNDVLDSTKEVTNLIFNLIKDAENQTY